MKERPILFSGPMVRAILNGTKTQTRRIAKIPSFWSVPPARFANGFLNRLGCDTRERIACPYGDVGDRLWVKETWHPSARMGVEVELEYLADESARLVTCHTDDLKPTIDRMLAKRAWVPSIFMPRWASRITLEVVSVRVERLQAISEADAVAEGIEPVQMPTGEVMFLDYLEQGAMLARSVSSYATLWESINGPGSWSANPWVWVVEFKRKEPA